MNLSTILRAASDKQPVTQATKTGLFLLPFALLARLAWEKHSNPWNYWQFVQEDSTAEWLTAGFYLLAVPFALFLAWRFFRAGQGVHALLVAVLAGAMFFVGMEEISWGQRVLGIETPRALAEINLQEEANLHNLAAPELLQWGFLIIGLYGTVASRIMPSVLRPVFGERADSLAGLVSPPDFVKPYFLQIFLIQALFFLSPLLQQYLGASWGYSYKPDEGYYLISRDREVAECILALGFLLFVGWHWVRHVGGRPGLHSPGAR